MVYLPPDERRFTNPASPEPIVALDPEIGRLYMEQDYDPRVGVPGILTTEDEVLIFQKRETTVTQLDDGIVINRIGYNVIFSHPDILHQIILIPVRINAWAYQRTWIFGLCSRRVFLDNMRFEQAIRRALRVYRCDVLEEFE